MIGLFGFSYTHEFFAWRSDGSADLEMNWRSRVIVYNVHCCTNTLEPLHQGTQKFITGRGDSGSTRPLYNNNT